MPPTTPTVSVEFIAASGVVTTELKVARWEKAFERVAGDVVLNKVKADFIDLDPDRFTVQVTDAAGNKDANAIETIFAKVKTDYDETAYELTLTETGKNTGVFQSKTLLMTSVKGDDTYKVDGVKDNDKDDRTLRIEHLGEKATVEYQGKATTAVVPLKKVVNLHINVVRLEPVANGGTAALFYGEWERDEKDITKSVRELVTYASAVFAPLGIQFKIVADKVNFVDPPKGVDLDDGLTGWSVKDGKVILSAEEKALSGC